MKLRAQFIAFLAILALFVLVSPDFADAQIQVKRDPKKAKQFREQGDKSYRQKNYRDAVEKYATAITFDPSNADAHYWKGYAHRDLKEYDQAVAELTQALELGYKALEVHRVRGHANFERGDREGALADFKEVFKAEPNNLPYLRAIADISFELKSYAEALAAYERLSTAFPQDGNLHFKIAAIHAANGNLEGQAASAEAAIRSGTQFLSEAQRLAADAYSALGRTQEAEAMYLKVLLSNPDSPAIYRTLAEMYRSQSRFNDAIEVSRRALRLYPNDGGFYTDISWYYSLAGRHEDAVQAAQAGIRFLPNQYMAYTNLCRAYNDLGKYELAISACNGALRIKPDDGETFFYMARANDMLNRSTEATRLYKRAVNGLVAFTQENPNYSDGFYLLGNAYFADNQPANAIAAYKKCLQLSPLFVRARYNLAMVYLDQKDKAAAIEQYQALLNSDRELAGRLKTQIDKTP